MKVYKIKMPNGSEFVTNNTDDLETMPVGSTITIADMTPAEYHNIPATCESASAFDRHGIRMAQVVAAENVVVESLRRRGLA